MKGLITMPFKVVRNDITKMKVDAIVNAANTNLRPGGGVCGAIFAAAGYDMLEKACIKIRHCDTGSAVVTKGYNLGKYIIHTVGPIYDANRSDNEMLLYSCYKSSLILAKKKGVKSIAFPLVSAGIYGYPKNEALEIAVKAITDFLNDNDMEVYLVIYDKQSFKISSERFSDIREYIDERLVVEEDYTRRRANEPIQRSPSGISLNIPMSRQPGSAYSDKDDIEDMLKCMDKSFSEYLLELIDESGMTDAQVYKKANIDRKLFSKIRSNPQYKPSKVTAAAFAIALELNMTSARSLIEKAGYSLTHSSKFDIILEYFIERRIYNIFEINNVLFTFDQPLIGT